MDKINMRTEMGTKWFTVYTKWRPWLVVLSACGIFKDFEEHTAIYLGHWVLWPYLLFAITAVVLQMCVFVKSKNNYVSFVQFVEGVLIFEVVMLAYQFAMLGVVEKTSSSGEVVGGYELIRFLLVLIVGYFLWYRLNINYFRRRVRANSCDVMDGVKSVEKANLVSVIVKNEDGIGQTTYQLIPLRIPSTFVDEQNWRTEISALRSAEVYERYRNTEEWSYAYRALCYEELMKRQDEC